MVSNSASIFGSQASSSVAIGLAPCQTASVFSVTTGDPSTFRSLTVGRVVETEFLADEKRIRHRIFVEQPYDVLVTDTTRFWSVSGVGACTPPSVESAA